MNKRTPDIVEREAFEVLKKAFADNMMHEKDNVMQAIAGREMPTVEDCEHMIKILEKEKEMNEGTSNTVSKRIVNVANRCKTITEFALVMYWIGLVEGKGHEFGDGDKCTRHRRIALKLPKELAEIGDQIPKLIDRGVPIEQIEELCNEINKAVGRGVPAILLAAFIGKAIEQLLKDLGD